MQNVRLKNKVLIYLYGLPGSGKTFVSRQLSKNLGLAHVSGNRLRYELFDKSNHDKNEHQIITHLMSIMAEQFLNAGVSVVYDISANRISERRLLKKLAQEQKAKELLIWLQIDTETARIRAKSRDHRKNDDKYCSELTPEQFDQYMRIMQNPIDENYLVLSGKHTYDCQEKLIMRRLNDMGLIEDNDVKIAKPELINLVSRAQAQAGRVDLTRRNVIIR